MKTFYFLSIVFGLFTIIGTALIYINLKPAYRGHFILTLILCITTSGLVGITIGVQTGQRRLLETSKAYFYPTIKGTSGYDERGVRTVLYDTTFTFSTTERPLIVPYLEPRAWYLVQRDTIWSNAVFTYQSK